MNEEWIKGNWKELKGSIRQKWTKLTDVDLDAINGRQEELLGRLQKRYGYAKLEAQKKIDEFKAELASSDSGKH